MSISTVALGVGNVRHAATRMTGLSRCHGSGDGGDAGTGINGVDGRQTYCRLDTP